MDTVFTFPGKIGDTLLQWPVAAAWHKQTGKEFEVWLDENTCKPLVNLLGSQPGVKSVKCIPGIESYHCGGQPYHFNLKASDFEGKTVYHLGMREFPKAQITIHALEESKVNVARELVKNPCLVVKERKVEDRVVIHGQSVCAHTGSVPAMWRFLNSIRKDLESRFSQICFIGTKEDLAAGLTAYPEWNTFHDEGDIIATAEFIASSKLVIAAGSSMAVLAGALGVPCIRVHDRIGTHPKSIWSNLGDNQLNATEVELRTLWPEWRDKNLDTVQHIT